MTPVLCYAPDNASLVVRLALHAAGMDHATRLIDRRAGDQRSPGYLRLNPNGLIPTLETADGPLFETGAILLWIAERTGRLAPPPGDPARGRLFTWLFWLSNTLHATERMLFYPATHVDGDWAPLAARTRERLAAQFDILEGALSGIGLIGGAAPTILDCYLGPLCRWPALYAPGAPDGWFTLRRWPTLHAAMAAFEGHPAARAVAAAEGLGPRPFTDPILPDPPEGSAT